MRKIRFLEGEKLSRMITTTTIGAKEEPYPMIQNVWEFFSEKGPKTVFVSVGTGSTCLPDLEFAETIGCPLLKLDTPQDSVKWTEVKEILKSRKPSETTSEFAKVASRKWVLPKNLHIQEGIPSEYNGSLELDGKTYTTKGWYALVKDYCMSMGIPEENVHIDLLKVDTCSYESVVLNGLIQSGFRPSLLLINWVNTPDTNLQSLLLAANIQMIGYSLIGKEGSRFLYYYTDVNYYETTSWETVSKKMENPLISNLLRSVLPGTEGNFVHFPVDK